MLSRVLTLHDVEGVAGRTNTMAYVTPRASETTPLPHFPPSDEEREGFEGHVVFFPGDIQDFSSEMRKHHSCWNFVEWSYEMTLEFLSRKFPLSHVWLVRPAKKAYHTVCIYKHFVRSESLMGVPSHTTDYDGINHLEALLSSAASRTSIDCAGESPIVIVGFSKGCIVLNQFLYEMSRLRGDSTYEGDHPPPSPGFVKRIRGMTWLDGGHSGEEEVWVTSPDVIGSLPHIPQCLPILFRIHVTPYQVRDLHRSWKGEAEREFIRLLSEAGLDVREKLHSEDEEATIDTHLRILYEF